MNLSDNNRLAVTLVGNKQNNSSFDIPPSSVSVIVLRIALSHDDLISLMTVELASSKNKAGFMNSLGARQVSSNASSAGYVIPPEQNNATDFNPFNFLKNIQIGVYELSQCRIRKSHICEERILRKEGSYYTDCGFCVNRSHFMLGEPGAPGGPITP